MGLPKVSLYGHIALLKDYCHDCKTEAFIVKRAGHTMNRGDQYPESGQAVTQNRVLEVNTGSEPKKETQDGSIF